jgi:hypothetical protein
MSWNQTRPAAPFGLDPFSAPPGLDPD